MIEVQNEHDENARLKFLNQLKLVDPKMYVSSCVNGERLGLPNVYAFEIESSLRKLFEEVLNPIMKVNIENTRRLGHLEDITK